MGQLVMSSPFQSGFFEVRQIESAIRECAGALLLRRSAIEIDEFIRAGREKAGENAGVKISARRRIDIIELRPSKIPPVFGADQSRDVAGMPTQRKHHAHKPPDKCGSKQQIIRRLERDSRA
jgi:hypothetical protein